jgi:hypothetical protein
MMSSERLFINCAPVNTGAEIKKARKCGRRTDLDTFLLEKSFSEIAGALKLR